MNEFRYYKCRVCDWVGIAPRYTKKCDCGNKLTEVHLESEQEEINRLLQPTLFEILGMKEEAAK